MTETQISINELSVKLNRTKNNTYSINSTNKITQGLEGEIKKILSLDGKIFRQPRSMT